MLGEGDFARVYVFCGAWAAVVIRFLLDLDGVLPFVEGADLDTEIVAAVATGNSGGVHVLGTDDGGQDLAVK